MGLSGTSPMSLLLILLIVLALFGSRKLKNIGEDLGQAIRAFRRSMDEDKPTVDAVDKPQAPKADDHGR